MQKAKDTLLTLRLRGALSAMQGGYVLTPHDVDEWLALAEEAEKLISEGEEDMADAFTRTVEGIWEQRKREQTAEPNS